MTRSVFSSPCRNQCTKRVFYCDLHTESDHCECAPCHSCPLASVGQRGLVDRWDSWSVDLDRGLVNRDTCLLMWCVLHWLFYGHCIGDFRVSRVCIFFRAFFVLLLFFWCICNQFGWASRINICDVKLYSNMHDLFSILTLICKKLLQTWIFFVIP